MIIDIDELIQIDLDTSKIEGRKLLILGSHKFYKYNNELVATIREETNKSVRIVDLSLYKGKFKTLNMTIDMSKELCKIKHICSAENFTEIFALKNALIELIETYKINKND